VGSVSAPATDPGPAGQLRDPSGSVVLDALVLLGGGSASYAHVHRGTASEGAAECVGIVQVALVVLQIRLLGLQRAPVVAEQPSDLLGGQPVGEEEPQQHTAAEAQSLRSRFLTLPMSLRGSSSR
jgi:hypothetical protein